MLFCLTVFVGLTKAIITFSTFAKRVAVGLPPSQVSSWPDLCDSGIMALVVAHTARIFILYICSP